MNGRRILPALLTWLAAAFLAGATALLGAIASRQIEAVRDSGVLLEPASVLIAVAAGGATLVSARLSVCAMAAAIALLTRCAGGRITVAARIAVAASPRSMRPALAALLVGGLALAVAAPASAAPTSVIPAKTSMARSAPTAVSSIAAAASTGEVGTPASAPSLPAPGWVPSPPPRPAGAGDRGPGALVELVSSGAVRRDAGADAGADELVVRRGDTLWAIAARALGPGASDAEIAAEWPRWWQRNKPAIGENPDLLIPGTRLTAPAFAPASTKGS